MFNWNRLWWRVIVVIRRCDFLIASNMYFLKFWTLQILVTMEQKLIPGHQALGVRPLLCVFKGKLLEAFSDRFFWIIVHSKRHFSTESCATNIAEIRSHNHTATEYLGNIDLKGRVSRGKSCGNKSSNIVESTSSNRFQ